MSGPDYEHGYLRIPLAVWQALYCRAPLTRRQLQLVSTVLRESWGWQRRGGQVQLWTRPLTPRQLAQATGLATDHLSRDLQALVARGVLCEQGRRYQFVPDPRLWKTRPASALKARRAAPKPPPATAESAPSPPVLKKENKKQRNVLPLPRNELSPIGDNSQRRDLIPRRGKASADRVLLEERFLQVVIAFAGALPEAQTERLRTWIRHEGVRAVWGVLGSAFRQGPRAVRQCLHDRLGKPSVPRG